VFSLVSVPFYLAYMISPFSFLFYFLYSSMVLLSFLHHELQHEQDKERGQRRYNGISEHRGELLRTSSVFFLSFKKTFFVLNPGIFSNPGALLVLLLSGAPYDSLTLPRDRSVIPREHSILLWNTLLYF
jgi:hypothetical protein